MKTIGVLLAAGFGTRLKPSTDFCPKPLIPVAGVEPLFYALWRFYRSGLRKIVVNGHHLGSQVEASVAQWSAFFPDCEIRYVEEKKEILGTGGAILNMIAEFPDWFDGSHSLLIQNADTLCRVDLQKILFQLQHTSAFSVSKREIHLKKFGPVWIDDAGQYVAVGSKFKPKEPLHAAHF